MSDSDNFVDLSPDAAQWGHNLAKDADGLPLHYVQMGQARSDVAPVCLLHGWPGFWYDWRRLLPDLASFTQVVAPDLRGFGKSAKHAITGLTKATGLDGRPFDINCGQIDIGNAATEITARMKDGVLQANGSVVAEPTLEVEQVARAVVYMANLPLDVNVPFMTVMASGMPFLGRG